MSELWVTNLSNYSPDREGHWPAYVAGFTLSKNGRIWLSDNKPIIINKDNRKGIMAPCHRDLIDGQGDNETLYSGLYCYNPKDKEVTLWMYPNLEHAFNDEMKKGLKSLIGVHKITSKTKVLSNTHRNTLFTLEEI